ncbi:hypothetical protein KEM54_001429 [Ascosphaera aggregata]|nr:hypothetical protein KEM54_001429 [Ascosphaera aggregata]
MADTPYVFITADGQKKILRRRRKSDEDDRAIANGQGNPRPALLAGEYDGFENMIAATATATATAASEQSQLEQMQPQEQIVGYGLQKQGLKSFKAHIEGFGKRKDVEVVEFSRSTGPSID